jgi:hypothetical protein
LTLYGFGNWEHLILEDGIRSIESANVLEQYYIQKYSTIDNGYNLTIGGGAIILTEESEAYRLKQLKESTRLRYNKAPQEFWDYSTSTKYIMISGDLEVALGLTPGVLSCVATAKCKSREGVALYSTYLSGYCPTDSGYSFEHAEHGVFNGSIPMLIKAYPECKYSGVHSIATGIKKSYKGWTLVGYQHNLCKKGIDPKCVRIKAISADTLEELSFGSYTEAAEYFSMHRHSIKLSVNTGRLVNRFKLERM